MNKVYCGSCIYYRDRFYYSKNINIYITYDLEKDSDPEPVLCHDCINKKAHKYKDTWCEQIELKDCRVINQNNDCNYFKKEKILRNEI